MKRIAFAALPVVAVLTAAAAGYAQDAAPKPQQNQPGEQWLKQLVGEWDVKYKMYMQPDAPAMEAAGTETVRAIGDYFIIAEAKFTLMGMPMTGVMQLGYLEEKEHYAGTWIDSMNSYLWLYEGTVNEAGDTLTLNTEGPSMQEPGATAKYKEIITIKSKDHRTFSSSIETEDGEWFTILEAEYTRKK